MPIPSYQDLMLPALKLLSTGHARVPDVVPQLQRELGISDDEASELLPSGKQTLLYNRTAWAVTYLYQANLLLRVKRGHYEVSKDGKALLAQERSSLRTDDLKGYDKFQEFMNRSGSPKPNEPTQVRSVSSEATPVEALEIAYSELERQAEDELLQLLLEVSPARFEQVIVDLLTAMGYGGNNAELAKAVGQSGDGGIDGVIPEDPLGLDAVYIQAKRYDPGNSVGRPALQAFVGSLTGESATKGVFVTTSQFSKQAHEYVQRVQHRIVLIDGPRLVKLMLTNGVGVRPRRTIVLKSIDEDYFSEGDH